MGVVAAGTLDPRGSKKLPSWLGGKAAMTYSSRSAEQTKARGTRSGEQGVMSSIGCLEVNLRLLVTIPPTYGRNNAVPGRSPSVPRSSDYVTSVIFLIDVPRFP